MRAPGPAAAVCIVVLAALASQATGLLGPFLWDDLPLLAHSDLYTSPERLGEALVHPLGKETFYWRPLVTTLFLGESMLHGGGPTGFRIVGALLHAGVAALVLGLLGKIAKSPWAALLGALAYAVHPVHAETVTWVSARFDLMAGLLTLGCLATLGGAGDRKRRWRLPAVALLAAAAALSKESAFVLPALVLCWDLARDPPAAGGLVAALRHRWQAAAWAAGGIFVVVVVRMEVLGYVVKARDASVEQAGGVLAHALLTGRAVGTYVGALVVPFGVVGPAHHVAQPVASSDPWAWAGLAVLAALVASAAVALRRRPRLGLLLLGFLVSLAPVVQVFPLDMAGSLYAADRFLYLPAFFAVAALVDVLHVLPERSPFTGPRLAVAGAVLVAAMAGYKTFVVLPRWGDSVRFWESARDTAPGSDVVLANLTDCYLGADRPADAERTARELVRLWPGRGYQTLLTRALWGTDRGEDTDRGRDAEEVLSDGLRARPQDVTLLLERGDVRIRMGRADEALVDYETAQAIEAGSTEPRFRSWEAGALAGMAEAVAALGTDVEGAYRYAERAARRVEAGDRRTWLRLARARLRLGEAAASVEALEKLGSLPVREWIWLVEIAVEVAPEGPVLPAVTERARGAGADEAVLAGARATGHARAGRYEEAASAYRRAVELAPETWDFSFYLHRLVSDGKAPGDAISLARRLVELRPRSAQAADLLGYELYDAGDAKAAEEELSRALDLDPSYAEARYHLGMLWLRKGLREAGTKQIRRARSDAESAGNTDLVSLIDRQIRR